MTNGPDLQAFIFCKNGVAPQIFQLIEFSRLPVEYMHYCVEIIDQHPEIVAGAFDVIRIDLDFFAYSFLYIIDDRPDLSIGISFTNDKKVGRRIIQFAHIQFDNMLGFNILHTVYDQIIQGFIRIFTTTSLFL